MKKRIIDALVMAAKRNTPTKALTNERGVSLMIVLWVMVFLLIITVEFAYTMRVEGFAIRNFKDEVSAHYLALAGINLAAGLISSGGGMSVLDDNGALVFLKKDGGALMSRVQTKRELDLGEGHISYYIEDEAGKINLNTASRETLAALLEATGSTGLERDTIADSILDWRDSNHEYHLNGAEDDYYLALPTPYEAKDANFDTVEELLLVKGVTPEIFYGSDHLPPEVKGKTASNEERRSGIARYLTVKSNGKINLNTAPKPVLEAAFGKTNAIEIMLHRSAAGYFEKPAYGGVTASNVYSIIARGDVRGLIAGISVVAERRPGKGSVVFRYWKNEGASPD